MGLTQIDLIKQIYYFFCDFRESLFHMLQMPQKGAERGIAKRDTMSCEACDAEPTEARHLARGERQRNPG